MEDYQLRVVREKSDLGVKVEALELFISGNPMFLKLPVEEQDRLTRQLIYMQGYSATLTERIAAWKRD
jgi:hypothetical protein